MKLTILKVFELCLFGFVFACTSNLTATSEFFEQNSLNDYRTGILGEVKDRFNKLVNRHSDSTSDECLVDATLVQLSGDVHPLLYYWLFHLTYEGPRELHSGKREQKRSFEVENEKILEELRLALFSKFSTSPDPAIGAFIDDLKRFSVKLVELITCKKGGCEMLHLEILNLLDQTIDDAGILFSWTSNQLIAKKYQGLEFFAEFNKMIQHKGKKLGYQARLLTLMQQVAFGKIAQ